VPGGAQLFFLDRPRAIVRRQPLLHTLEVSPAKGSVRLALAAAFLLGEIIDARGTLPQTALPISARAARRLSVAVYALGEHEPRIHPTAFVHPEAVVIGQVSIGAQSTVWPAAVLRGDYGRISVGERTSIQDGTVVHATAEHPTLIGSRCVVGHLAHLEGCTIEDDVLVGSGSVVLHRVVVHSGALVGAGAVVPNGMEVPGFAMALGVPAKLRLNAVARGEFLEGVELYVGNGLRYRETLRRLD
jgi:carbonic anhydrase/acetyltransferase-like protein (isoleucine patch superfamily)